MHRLDAPRSTLPASGTTPDDVLIGLLQEASLTIDGILRSALGNSETSAVDLVEASQALHRALLVLMTAKEDAAVGVA